MQLINVSLAFELDTEGDAPPMIVNLNLSPKMPMFPDSPTSNPVDQTQGIVAGASPIVGGLLNGGGNFDGHRIEALLALAAKYGPQILALLALLGLKVPPLPIPTPPAA